METPLQIAFKGMDNSEAWERLIRDRVDRLERFNSRITGCRVLVEVPHRSPESGKAAVSVSVEVQVPGKQTVIGRDEQQRHDMKNDQLAVVNRAFDAAQRQLGSIEEMRKRL